MSLPDDTPLADARTWVREHRERGIECPCCGQFAKLYRRSLSATMAYALILIDRHFASNPADRWLHVPSYLTKVVPDQAGATLRGGDWAKLAYWRLIEEREQSRDDGARHAGYWRITSRGRDFVEGRLAVPAHALVFAQHVLGYDDRETRTIQEALGSRFDYQALMAPVRRIRQAEGNGQLTLLGGR